MLRRKRSVLSLDINEFDCDLLDFKEGKAQALNTYHGMFMEQYAWARPMAEALSAEKAAR